MVSKVELADAIWRLSKRVYALEILKEQETNPFLKDALKQEALPDIDPYANEKETCYACGQELDE
jgi:hypothetical protein